MIIFPKLCALALSVLSARSDLKSCRISNDLLLCFLVVALFSGAVMRDVSDIRACLLGLVLPFLLLWIFFRFRKIGAGDIKLFCVLGALMGPAAILWCMFFTFVFGGAASAFRLLVLHRGASPAQMRLRVAVYTVPAVLMWAGGVYG